MRVDDIFAPVRAEEIDHVFEDDGDEEEEDE